jgi:hypothetical protein
MLVGLRSSGALARRAHTFVEVALMASARDCVVE